MQFKILLYLIVLLICLPLCVGAQNEAPKKKEAFTKRMERFRVKKKDFKKYRYLSAGGSINLLTYYGDLAPTSNIFSTELSLVKPGITAFVNYRYGPRMSVKAELLYGRLTGDDYASAMPGDEQSGSRYLRNLSFRNDILDLSIMSQIYVFKNYLDFRERKSFNIYFNGGFSLFYHSPKAKIPDFKISGERYSNSGEWFALRPLGTEGQFSEFYDVVPYSKIQFSIPFGGGVNFKLSDRFDLAFEINYRLLLTDHIDDVSGKYVDLGALDGDLAKSMADRSLEEYSVMTGDQRDLSGINPIAYISEFDGSRYTVVQEPGTTRGGSGNDSYLATGFKIAYILNNTKSSED